MKKHLSITIHANACLLIWVVIGSILASMAGCHSMEFQSRWTDRPLAIDGTRNAAWDSVMVRVEDKPLMVGLVNDNDYLYLSLVTDDRSLQRQMMFRGLTVWFDYQGGEEKRFGVHFPLSPFESQSEGFFSGRQPGEPGQTAGSVDTMRPRFSIDSTDVEIIGPTDGEQHRLSVAQLRQVAVKLNLTGGSLIYQLKVPLADNGADPYAIGTKAGETIGIGLQTMARSEGRTQPEGGSGERPSGRGYGGGGRGRGGYGGGGGRSGQRTGNQQTEPLDVWAQVHLAPGVPIPEGH